MGSTYNILENEAWFQEPQVSMRILQKVHAGGVVGSTWYDGWNITWDIHIPHQSVSAQALDLLPTSVPANAFPGKY